MSTHNICIRQEIRKILCGYPLLSVAMGTLTPAVSTNIQFQINCTFLGKLFLFIFLCKNMLQILSRIASFGEEIRKWYIKVSLFTIELTILFEQIGVFIYIFY